MWFNCFLVGILFIFLITSSVEETPEEGPPGGPPINLTFKAICSRSITLEWSPPENEVVLGYYIGYKVSGTSNRYLYKTLIASERDREEVILRDLRQNTQYSVIVQAYNRNGAGPLSEEVKVQTLEMDAPTSPQIQVTNTTFSSIHLDWEPIYGHPIDGYKIFQREAPSTAWKEVLVVGQQAFFKAIDLKCGTRYEFYLVAYNKAGKGEPSDMITAKTQGSVPVAPVKESVVTVNKNTAFIHLNSWHNGGCPITKYKLRYRVIKNNWEWMEIRPNFDEQEISLKDLIASTRYELHIKAYNDVGVTVAEYTFKTKNYSQEHNPGTGSDQTILRDASNKHSTHEYCLVSTVVITLLVFDLK